MQIELNHSTRLYFPYIFDNSCSSSSFSEFSKQISTLTLSSLFLHAPYLKNESDDESDNDKSKSKDAYGVFEKEALWEKQSYKLENKILGVADNLINGFESKACSNGFFGIGPYKLSSHAIKVLNQGSKSSVGSGVSFSLKKASLVRLSENNISAPIGDDSWPLMFNSIWFFGFNTGIGMMVIDISYQQPKKNGLKISNLEELQELNYVISRKVSKRKSAKSIWGNKGIADLVDALIPASRRKSINLNKTKDHDNVYTYTAVSTNQKLSNSERKTFLFRMSRKYNDLYLPENTDEHIVYFEPFKPITHAFSLEGATSFIDFTYYGDNIPQTIQNFTKDTIPKAYVPIILLTYAEHIFLREMSSSSSDSDQVDMQNPTNANLSRLRKFKAKLYGFRLNFEYVQISTNTNHNLFYDANKKSLTNKRLLDKLSIDTQEIEQYISDYISQKQENRFRKIGILASLFAVIIGWVDLWGLNLHQIFFGNIKSLKEPSVMIFLSILTVLAVVVLFLNKQPKDKE